MKIKLWFQENKTIIKFVVMFFVITRVILALIGVSALTTNPKFDHLITAHQHFNNYNFLDIWGQWDSGWYLKIATHGYSSEITKGGLIDSQANYAFFPLYPLLMRYLGYLTTDIFIAGLIIANLSFLIAAFLLYKIILLDEDENTARRAIKYLFLFPTAFIFSAVLSESLFLMLALAAFYSARKKHYWLSGILGFLLALTRPLGVFICLPLFLILTHQQFLTKQINHLKDYLKLIWNKNILALCLIPLGFIVWCFFNYNLTGDPFAFMHIQSAWNRHLTNFLSKILGNLRVNFIQTRLLSIFTISGIYFIVRYYRLLRLEYLIYAIYSLIIPLSTGLGSLPRYLIIIFPLYIIFAKTTNNENEDTMLTIIFALLQGFLMVFWSLGTDLII